VALPRYGYIKSTNALYDNLDKFSQDFVRSTHGTLNESEAHTRRDLLCPGIQRVARPHHHVEPDVPVRIHAQRKAQESKFIGWVQNAVTMH